MVREVNVTRTLEARRNTFDAVFRTKQQVVIGTEVTVPEMVPAVAKDRRSSVHGCPKALIAFPYVEVSP